MVTYILRRELLLLREDADWLKVECAWGKAPGFAFLPPAALWDSVVPDWLRGRREEAVRTIEELGLEVKDDDRPLPPGAFGRGDGPGPGPAPTRIVTLDPIPMDELRRAGGK